MCHAQLKRLDTQRKRLKLALKEVLEKLKTEEDKSQKQALQECRQNIEHELHKTKISRQSLVNESTVVVTEHAILRYFERVLGYDIEKIKADIVPEKTAHQIKICQSGLFPVSNFKLRVQKGTVVTLLTQD